MAELYINGRFLTRRMTGVDRFAREVASAIDRMLAAGDPQVAGLTVTMLVPQSEQPVEQYRHIAVRQVGKRQGAAWEQLELPRAVPSGALLLSLCNTGPALRREHAVVIHDAGTERMPQAYSRGFRWWYRVLMPTLGRRARHLLTVSEFSRRELEAVYAFPTGKTVVVPEGGEHILRVQPDPGALERFGLHQRPYLLAVSSMAANKNFRLIVEALALLDHPPFDIAIAGGANPRVFGNAGNVETANVRWLGYVSDVDLRTLYGGALGFVFPSLYEGYGLPPLEAMNCGCPVLVSTAASIPEVCGDAGLYFDPHDAVALKDAMLRLAGDGALREQMRERGYQRAQRFSWDRAAREVLAACGIAAPAVAFAPLPAVAQH
ncbi:glycosyltransferase family 4 protein [Duganella sp. PWIR1]